ncbi:PIG-L family deacetylase [Paenibacillus sp.]|uniref:PIG-L family deacetylase n=1 Tax=Paenibacillus sp. TaxID=58172 RepID=UPI002D337B68|nr:PIG-L family deacetylase [Paenibacillus sp.]HZG85613.1 PIG-L family deacetylase [Paenibacillus sp.]
MTAGTKSILGLFAHPDDETFICGGTLAHYAKRDASVAVVSATRGEMGRRMGYPPRITRESMPRIREEELREACRRLGIEAPIFLGIRDKTVEYEDRPALVARLAAIIQERRPDVVLTFHPAWGGHPDHCAIGEAARSAVETFGADGPALLYISFGDPLRHAEWAASLAAADVVRVDVRDSLREKLNAFRAHRSQTEMDSWLWEAGKDAVRRFKAYEYFVVDRSLPGRELPEWFGA